LRFVLRPYRNSASHRLSVKWILHQQNLEAFLSDKDLKWMDWAFLPVLTLALLLRLPWMSQSLWYDEISVTHGYLKNIFHLLDAWTFDTNMPFHYTLMFFWGKLFQDTEFSLRFPPLIFGLASLILSYEVAKKIFDRKIALLTCLLLAISPVHIWYSTEARPYAGMIFFLLLALLAFLRLHEPELLSMKNRVAWLGIYFFSILLGTFSHLYMIIPVLVFSGISLIQKDHFRRIFLVLNGINVLLLLCFVSLKFGSVENFPTDAIYLRPFTLWEAWLLFFNWFPTGNTISPITPSLFSRGKLLNHPFMLFYQLFFFCLFLKGMVAIVREPNDNKKLLGCAVLGFLVSTPIFLFIVNTVDRYNIYIERSAYVGLPFFFMTLARGVEPETKNYLSIFLLTGLVMVCGLSTLGLFQHTNACTVAPCKQDWRSAAKYLAEDVGSSKEKAAVIQMLQARSLPYYDSDFEDHIRLVRLSRRLPQMLRMVERIFGTQNRAAYAVRREIEEVKNQLEIVRKDKIAVLRFSEIYNQENLPYETLYLCENPYNPWRANRLLNWIKRRSDFHFSGKKRFHALNIYKFVRR
jgi:hypothetical protein